MRKVKDANIESKNGRRELRRKWLALRKEDRPREPHWKAIVGRASIGYRINEGACKWVARYWRPDKERYVYTTLGDTDDLRAENGTTVLNHPQAAKAATAWFDAQEREAAGLAPGRSRHYTVGDALDDYLADYEKRGRSINRTKAAIESHIRPTLGHHRLAKLTRRAVEDWHRGLAETPRRIRSKRTMTGPAYSKAPAIARARQSTANRLLTILKAALNFAHASGHIDTDAAWKLVKPFHNVEVARPRYLTAPECGRLVAACSDEFRPLVQGALATGARYGALRILRCRHYNRQIGRVEIPPEGSKTTKGYHVTLTDEGREFFDAITKGRHRDDLMFTRSDGRQWGPNHQTRPMKRACKIAKIDPPISFHILRHTYGSLLTMGGAHLKVTAAQLGHASTRMTEKHYGHLSDEFVTETVRAKMPRFWTTGKGGDKIAPMKRARLR